MGNDRIVWLYTDKKTPYSDHYNLLIDSGLYKEILVPPNVNLKDQDSIVTHYYFQRLQEEYVGAIIVLDGQKIFISKDNE